MAYTTIDNSELYFQTKLYTGTGSTLSVTLDGSEDMQPDMIWIKVRNQDSSPMLQDAVRGTDGTSYRAMKPSASSAQTTHAEFLLSIQSDGFTVGSNGKFGADGDPYIAWCWVAGGGAGSSNTTGATNTTSTSVNTTSKFSISTYTGTGSATTIGHGMGVAPACIICKEAGDSGDWVMYHHKNTDAPETDVLEWNNTTTTADNDGMWNDTAPSSTLITLGGSAVLNNSSDSYVSYAWGEVSGFSMFGKYVGNADTDGTFIYTGFRPAMFIFKETGNAENWMIYDNKRTDQAVKSNPIDQYMFVNTNGVDTSGVAVDFCSNGIKLRANNGHINEGNYIFMAWAESPFVNSNGVPNNAQ